jgi:serine/threonine protein kinase
VDGGRWQRVKDLFAAALEKEAAERDAFLDEACGADPALRAEVDSLLAAHETTDDFIERPAAHRALDLEPEAPPPSWIGRRIGDYRIVAEVGRGGMSEVYKGVRDDDEYQKQVAIKVLRAGYGTRSLLKRFKVETQILATLDHPNIARLLDAGSSEEGLPYLVMEHIQGRPIDEYCREHKLGLRARLELFRTLCDAVQYVHQHLMVHGDLKCSNVLVSENGTV